MTLEELGSGIDASTDAGRQSLLSLVQTILAAAQARHMDARMCKLVADYSAPTTALLYKLECALKVDRTYRPRPCEERAFVNAQPIDAEPTEDSAIVVLSEAVRKRFCIRFAARQQARLTTSVMKQHLGTNATSEKKEAALKRYLDGAHRIDHTLLAEFDIFINVNHPASNASPWYEKCKREYVLRNAGGAGYRYAQQRRDALDSSRNKSQLSKETVTTESRIEEIWGKLGKTQLGGSRVHKRVELFHAILGYSSQRNAAQDVQVPAEYLEVEESSDDDDEIDAGADMGASSSSTLKRKDRDEPTSVEVMHKKAYKRLRDKRNLARSQQQVAEQLGFPCFGDLVRHVRAPANQEQCLELPKGFERASRSFKDSCAATPLPSKKSKKRRTASDYDSDGSNSSSYSEDDDSEDEQNHPARFPTAN